jgi:Rab3 GTPase-activating protein catalytic subunit
MSAFKAANAGCVLGDFIRWYSPTDWIGDRKSGRLSARMSGDGNTWQALWDEAKPVPAVEQAALFEPKKEIAKALHYLETLSPRDFLEQAISVALSGILHVFSDPQQASFQARPTIYGLGSTAVTQALDSLRSAIQSSWLGCKPNSTFAAKEYETVWACVSFVELASARVTSLISKLGTGCERVACELAEHFECCLDTGEEREAVSVLLGTGGSLPSPDSREYIIDSRNDGADRPGCCRLYAHVSSQGFDSRESVFLACTSRAELS